MLSGGISSTNVYVPSLSRSHPLSPQETLPKQQVGLGTYQSNTFALGLTGLQSYMLWGLFFLVLDLWAGAA